MRWRPVLIGLTVAWLLSPGTSAQTPAPTPQAGDGLAVEGSVRTRVEGWDWFGGTENGTYAYSGTLARVMLSQVRTKLDWHLEFAAPVLVALPEQPLGAGPAGLGANYFVANDRSRQAASLFAKQAFVQFKTVGSVEGQSLTVGRLEFFDGAEVPPTNPTVATVKRDRVASRLLANFGFTHVQRSFDGIRYVVDRPTLNVTVLAARPTQGVFQVNGWGDLNINVVYGALTRQLEGTAAAAEWRVFGVAYSDQRHGLTKTDNRPLATRQHDQDPVTIGTIGGHYLAAIERAHGTIDLLVWGAAQVGSWGTLAHRAGAFAAEAGWQAHTHLDPWIRGGLNYASGDGNPTDATHGTFFQLLPTPRLYARFPFFNLMNSVDAFSEVMLRPASRVTTRVDVHSLRLADGHDPWYQGGGAFQPSTFGYMGLPVNGHRSLGWLYDASLDVALTTQLGVGSYIGYASGGPASAVSTPAHNHATLAFLELAIRF